MVKLGELQLACIRNELYMQMYHFLLDSYIMLYLEAFAGCIRRTAYNFFFFVYPWNKHRKAVVTGRGYKVLHVAFGIFH